MHHIQKRAAGILIFFFCTTIAASCTHMHTFLLLLPRSFLLLLPVSHSFWALLQISSQNHRMIWVGRDLSDHLVPTPCHRQGHLPLDQVVHSPIQPGLECFQGGGIQSLYAQKIHRLWGYVCKDLTLGLGKQQLLSIYEGSCESVHIRLGRCCCCSFQARMHYFETCCGSIVVCIRCFRNIYFTACFWSSKWLKSSDLTRVVPFCVLHVGKPMFEWVEKKKKNWKVWKCLLVLVCILILQKEGVYHVSFLVGFIESFWAFCSSWLYGRSVLLRIRSWICITPNT